MPRKTLSDLQQVQDNLNRRLSERGSKAQVRYERRYGYVGIDEYHGDSCQRTLTTGHTTGEAYDAMWNMIRALDLLP